MLVLFFPQRRGLLSGLPPSGFPTGTLYENIPMRATYPAHLFFFELITRTIYGAVSSTPLLPPPVLPQTSSSTSCCRTPSTYGLRSPQRNGVSHRYKTAG